MIYLDNSATTFPKPDSVKIALVQSLNKYCAKPGRSGHKMSLDTAKKIFECRQSICKLFNIDDESKVVFTSGCTQSLNTVIKGILRKGDHCVISCIEHNSVLRPLEKLKSHGVSYSIATVYPNDADKTVDSFRKCFNEKTKLVVCTHASNVFGFRLPVERICALAHSNGIRFCLDAAQSAGVLPINVSEHNYDFVCCAGHKGLYGPMGIGILIVNTEDLPDTLIEGGTGSESQNYLQPDFMPDRYESGTLNIPGICALNSSVEFVLKKGIENIHKYEINLLKSVYDNFSRIKKVKLYNKRPDINSFAPVLSFSVEGRNSEEVASYLGKNYGIAVRSGLHCSPLAHNFMNTIDEGVVRISPSVFTTYNQINKLIFAIKNYI